MMPNPEPEEEKKKRNYDKIVAAALIIYVFVALGAGWYVKSLGTVQTTPTDEWKSALVVSQTVNLTMTSYLKIDIPYAAIADRTQMKVAVSNKNASLDMGIWDYTWTVAGYDWIPWGTAIWSNKAGETSFVSSIFSIAAAKTYSMVLYLAANVPMVSDVSLSVLVR